MELLDTMIEAMRSDLTKIKGDAESVQLCLANVPESPGKVSRLRTELEEIRVELLKSQQQLSLKSKGVLSCLKANSYCSKLNLDLTDQCGTPACFSPTEHAAAVIAEYLTSDNLVIVHFCALRCGIK